MFLLSKLFLLLFCFTDEMDEGMRGERRWKQKVDSVNYST